MNKTKKERKEKATKLNKKTKRKSKNKSHQLRLIVPAALMVFAVMLVFLRPAFIGYFAFENVSSYTQDIDAVFVEDSVYLLYLEHEGELKSLKINGEIIGEGTAKVYLEAGNENYLIFDSVALEGKGLSGITGLSVGGFDAAEEQETNETIPANETLVLNETLDETEELNETILINESIYSNETVEKLTSPPENAEILIELEYNDGTEFDIDNNGIEAKDGIIDFKVNAEFNWDADEANLCAAWETYSLENESSVKVCYGNKICCNFIGLEPLTPNWNELFYSYYGRYGATENNRISAQVVYVDYSVNEENPYSYVYYSEWDSLNAIFLEKEEKITYFNDICVETCLLSLNETFYRLRVELENATLKLDNISYTIIPLKVEIVNNAPILLSNVSDILISRNSSISVDLSKYFFDEDNDSLKYAVYEMDNISVLIDGSIVTLIPDDGFTGIRHSFVTANDSKSIAVSNVFKVNVTDALIVENITAENITAFNVSEIPMQLAAEINKPVKWVKKVSAENNETIAKDVNVSFEIPENGFNTNVKDIKLDKIIDKNKIIEKAKVKDDKPKDNGMLGVESIEPSKVPKAEEKEIEFEDNFEINETKEYIVEYETEAPIAVETNISDYKKQIVVSSDVHYVDVLAYTDVPFENAPQNIRLYWVKNNSRELFTNVSYYDLNNNSLIDKIEWIIPSLSNQTFELEIIILNVQSYPTLGGKWTVRFNTTGTANLTIKGFNGTTFSEVPDDSTTPNDLDFLELTCNGTVVNATIVSSNNSEIPYSVYKIKRRIEEIKKQLEGIE